jgi:hypothetical protein
LVTGNDFIPAGQTSWKGSLAAPVQMGSSIAVQVQCAQAGYKNPYFIAAVLLVRSGTELGLSGNSTCLANSTVRFTRNL